MDNYKPTPELAALLPETLGNDVNGLNESVARRPTPVFWRTDGQSIAHADVIKHFYALDSDDPLLIDARARREITKNVSAQPIAKNRLSGRPEKISELVKQAGLDCGADVSGICEFDAEWTYDDRPVPKGKWTIVLGFAHDYENLKLAPSMNTYVEYVDQYARAGRTAKLLANWVRDQGWDAEAKTGPLSEDVLMIPAAIAAGLGELGKHGSLINPTLGSNMRLSMVMTDMPLVSDKPINFGVDNFCQICKACTKACPPMAISAAKKMVRGEKKWYVDFDQCLPYFVDNRTCGICIGKCPWSKPGAAEKIINKIQRQKL